MAPVFGVLGVSGVVVSPRRHLLGLAVLEGKVARNALDIRLGCVHGGALRTVTPYTPYPISYHLPISETPLNYHQGSIRCGLKVFSPQRWERFGVGAPVDTDDSVLSSSWLSAPLLTSRMCISGSDSKIGGIEPRSMCQIQRWDETRQKWGETGSLRDTASVR